MFISVERDHFKEIFIVKVLVLIQTKILNYMNVKEKEKKLVCIII